MSRAARFGFPLAVVAALASCGRDPAPQAPAAPGSAASKPAADGAAPDARAIVVREGDHVAVIVDVPATDARGLKITQASLAVEPPGAALTTSAPVRSPGGLTLEVRVPRGTSGVKLTGTSEDGSSWSRTIRTDLGAR